MPPGSFTVHLASEHLSRDLTEQNQLVEALASCDSIVMTATSPPSHAAFLCRSFSLLALAIPTNVQSRATSRSLVIRTRAALASSSADIVVAQPANARPIKTWRAFPTSIRLP